MTNSYTSTNGKVDPVNLKEAVLHSLPADNGLYLPTSIPRLPDKFFECIGRLSLQDIAFTVATTLFGDAVDSRTLKGIVDEAMNFPAPVNQIAKNTYVLELFHGPTLAFKDFGARFMARLIGHFVKDRERPLTVLVATSGDTGSAVAHGFLNVPGIEVILLYPKGQVSEIQEKQLTTMGHNITALEVEGSFDDCQRLVKQAFLDEDLNEVLDLTSANSINIARLVPQSFYYFYAYAQMADKTTPMVVSVPSGNFGNLVAGLLAKKMGLPIHRFVAATNVNDVVPNYLKTGTYTPRESLRTLSNAMDVGNPSNFARLLALYDGNLDAIRQDLCGYSFTDEETVEAIKTAYAEHNYILDPHGAVGYLALQAYREEHGELCNGLFLETAHPAKFLNTVEKALQRTLLIPSRLAACLQKEKQAITTPNDFDNLKRSILCLTSSKHMAPIAN